MSRFTIDRQLPQRSYLKYIYYSLGEDAPYIVRFPFFENISINESRKANYSQYSILADTEFDFEYIGAESRKFTLDFEVNLLHLLQESYSFNELTNPNTPQKDTKNKFTSFYKTNVNKNSIPYSKQLYQKYFSNPEVKSSASTVLDQLLNTKIDQFPFQPPPVFKGQLPFTVNNILGLLAFTKTKKSISSTIEPYLEILRTLYNAETLSERLATLEGLTQALDLEAAVNVIDITNIAVQNQAIVNLVATLKVIDQVVYYTNIVRSGVLSKGKGSTSPPPVIYLNHGILYQNIPCVCTDYSISVEKASTYDLPTLLPYTVKFSLNLLESVGYARKTEFLFSESGGLDQSLVTDELAKKYEEFVGPFNYGWTSVVNEPYSLDVLAEQ